MAGKAGRLNSQSGLPDDGRSPNGGLSFLRKQESRHFDRPGFRIKCGMTGYRARPKERNYAKQSQFPKRQNQHNFLF